MNMKRLWNVHAAAGHAIGQALKRQKFEDWTYTYLKLIQIRMQPYVLGTRKLTYPQILILKLPRVPS